MAREPACQALNIEVDQLASTLGDGWGPTLWGCAFEDFLATDLDDGRNLADAYLKQAGQKETAEAKRYLAGLRHSVMSLYEVSDIVPGESFLTRDLVRGGKLVRVTERSATRMMRQWDRIAMRIVQIGDKAVMGGGVLPFEHEPAETILDLIRHAVGKLRGVASGVGGDVETAVLQEMAADFSNVWLQDLLRKILTPMELLNSDGEELSFMTVRYTLKPKATAADVSTVLDTVPGLHRRSRTTWSWLREDAAPRAKSGGRRKSQRSLTTTSHTEEGVDILAEIQVKKRTVDLMVNSVQRAERARALIEPALAAWTKAPRVKTEPLDRADRTGSKTPPAALSPAEELTMIRHAMDQHYAKVLDEPIAMLGDLTPVEAVRTAEGRQKVADWLKFMENQTAKQSPDSPLGQYDFSWMWEKLGITDLRR